MSRAQAHLNDLDVAQDESGSDNDLSTQSSEGSSISQTISSVGSSQFPLFMADDFNDDSEGPSGDLSKVVNNITKIGLLQTS